MTRHWPIALVLALALAPTARAGELTAADLIALVKSGLGEDTITAQIDVTGTAIALAPADLIALKEAGASEALIQHAIRTRGARTATAAHMRAPEAGVESLGPVVRQYPATSTTYDWGVQGPYAGIERGHGSRWYGGRYGLGWYGVGVYAGGGYGGYYGGPYLGTWLGGYGFPFDDYGSPYGYSVGAGPARFYNDRRTYERSLELGLGHTVPFGWGYR